MKCEARNLSWGIDNRFIIENISFTAESDKITGIIGPNGSGKTSFLKNIYRIYKPTAGCVYIDGTELNNYSLRENSKMMAVVGQEDSGSFDFTVEEIVMMGRYPYKKTFEPESDEDRIIVTNAMHTTGLSGLNERSFLTLSGGEKQRVLIARAIAQKADLLVLDEPTNHLDVGYKIQIFEIVKQLDISVIATIHDINLAARYCDTLFIFNEGRIVAFGSPEDIITEKLMRDVFGVKTDITLDSETGKPRVFFTGLSNEPILRREVVSC